MRLAIADPPYLGRAERNYGPARQPPSMSGFGSRADGYRRARRSDRHPDAAVWDDPATHRRLVEQLVQRYDGWAVAMWHSNLGDYLSWCPVGVRVAVWVKRNPVPTGSRVTASWEPVVVFIPEGRRKSRQGMVVADSLAAAVPGTFTGAKPAAWTRWVLDMLGHDPELDTVDDLFAGSGAVAREIAQGVLL